MLGRVSLLVYRLASGQNDFQEAEESFLKVCTL
jgi:hypothetical protein